ncbi:choice-of-anchor J domain-containing protein [Flavobacterium sp.]|uniref:T9SS-dependent choice-of-anchor J family protein n=1 Tax=Flavobacterium sp. TaxID=239 RepID=UPI0026155C3B|nr:choice-of-anchor J domain-containing protein [Flavobacterium sp.]
MSKKYTFKSRFFYVFLILILSSNIYGQLATFDISGNFKVTGYSGLWWDYQYKPTGSSIYTQSAIQQSTSSSLVKLNPFISWDFRIRYYDSWGQPGTWSQISTVNSDYSAISKSVGYNFNFEIPALPEGWRGYRLQNTTSNYNSNVQEVTGSSGSSIYMGWQSGNGVMLVSPKITDLTTDKKVYFEADSYQGNYTVIIGTITDPYNPSTFHPLKTVNLSGSANNTIDVFFNNYVSQDQYIAIKSSGNYGDVYLDNFSYQQSVNCFDLTNVAVNNISEHSATVTYNSNTASSYEISLKNLRTGVTEIFTSNTNTFTFNTLAGLTNYEVKVRGNCAPNLYTNWSQIIPFSTPCNVVSNGYFTSFGEEYIIDPCWKKIESSTTINNSVGLNVNGNFVISPKSGSKLITISASTSTTQKGYLISPFVSDLDNNKRIKFYLSSYGSDYIDRSITIGTMSNPLDESTFVPLENILPENINQYNGYKVDGYLKEHIIYFNNYNTSLNHNYIAFKVNNSINYKSITLFIDDFTYENSPLCKEPTNLKCLTTSYNYANVKWDTFDQSSSEWEIEYGIKGFAIGSGTRIPVNSNAFTINSNLVDSQEYDFYVRTKCGSNYSNWSDRGYFKTKCIGFNAPYFNGFEDADFTTGTCWSRHTIDIRDSSYKPNSFVTIYKNNAHPTPPRGGNYAGYVTNRSYGRDPLSPQKNILITPRLIDLDNSKIIKFWGIQPSSGSTIEIGTLSNPEDYTTFHLFESIAPNSSTNNVWTQYTVDFSNYYGSDKFVGIRIKTANNYDGFLYVDDFSYENNPCVRPTNLTAIQKSNNSVELNWNTNNTNPVNCEIEYGYSGFTSGSGTLINVTSLPFVLTGLSANSEYEFRVRNICNSQSVIWSNKYAFKVSCTISAPFVENFDSYSVGDVRNETCWTINKGPIQLTWAFHNIDDFYLKNINSSPNILNLYKDDTIDLFLISPYLSDFDNTKKIKFWLLPFYSTQYSPQRIKIGTISNPLDRNSFEEFTTISTEDIPPYGKEFNIDFSTYTGSNKFIAFVFTNENNQTYFYIDDIQYLNNLPCHEPVNIVFKNITNNSCLVKWENNIAEPVEIEYGLKGFQRGTGTRLTTTTNETLISNLLESSDYDFYFTTICNSSNSHIVGPKSITTNCLSYSLPWTEKFDNLPSYGIDKLPNCMEVVLGGLQSYNTSRLLYNNSYNPDHTLNGNGDTSYLLLNRLHPGIVMPSFQLVAGVTYKFSADGRKYYEYGGASFRVFVGRGRSPHYMEVETKTIGQLTEYNYTTNSFYFTPLENGVYTFILQENSSTTEANMIVDNFNLSEGYSNIVTSNNEIFDFQYGENNKLIIESTENSLATIQTEVNNTSNKLLKMSGANSSSTWIEAPNTAWVSNQNHITKVNMKINAASMSSLFLLFDLKQTFNDFSNDSKFRVIVNGTILGTITSPETNNQDAFKTFQYDLTPFVGSDIKISLQHLGKSSSSVGDNAYLDNIKFSPTPLLSNDDYSFIGLKYYPNPVTNILNVENNSEISSVEIFTITGQSIFNKEYSTNNIRIDMNHLPNGVYFVKINSEDKNKTLKVVKE